MIDAIIAAAASQGHDCNLEHPIAQARAVFNDAIRQKQVGPIRRLLVEDAMLVTGSDSGVVIGRDQQLNIWRQDFNNPKRDVFVRTPRCIISSEIEPIATELGTWSGQPEVRDGSEISGDYTAKWRQVDGAWLIEAEIYTTMKSREALRLG